MSNNKSSSISSWDYLSEKIESLREALNTPMDESDSSVKSPESDLLYHYTENDAASLGTSVNETIESLREILNTPIDDIISIDKSSEESNELSPNDVQDNTNLSLSTDEDKELDEAVPSNMTEMVAETVEETDSSNETELEDPADANNRILKTDESEELDDKSEIQDIEEVTDTENETDSDDIIAPNSQIQQTDDSEELNDKPEIQDIEELTDTKNEMALDEITAPNSQIQPTDEPEKLDDKQEIKDVEIKINTGQSIKNEKIDNYWKKSETANPYILKVDESREELNRSLEMARELANQQSEETPKQEKKRFRLRFMRESKNGNHKSSVEKGKDKHSQKTTDFKPMVYEMVETYQDNQNIQEKQANQNKAYKNTTKQSDDRAKNSQEKEIINHRNRLEKSRSLGVPVFVKKPVNLEQIRQLKSMLKSQNDVKILVDTGSSQGRLLVISGQDPDTLLNTLSQLPIVKSTTVDDETINIVLEISDRT